MRRVTPCAWWSTRFGPAARAYSRTRIPSTIPAVFRRHDCRVFHFALDSTGWRVDHYEDYKVSLE
jgi:hypothetical protein